MAIQGVSRKAVPYVPERERSLTPAQNPTTVWIKPKDGHTANKTLAAYASSGRDGRGGWRELSTSKLDNADIQQFVEIVERWENYIFSERFPDLQDQGLMTDVRDEATLFKIAQDIDPELMNELFEASNDPVKLVAGSKKG